MKQKLKKKKKLAGPNSTAVSTSLGFFFYSFYLEKVKSIWVLVEDVIAFQPCLCVNLKNTDNLPREKVLFFC